MSKVTPEGMAFFMKRRHDTSDPWALVEALGIDVKWTDILSGDKLGRTGFPPFGAPVIYLSNRVKYSPLKTRVLAHELGHALLHEGTAAYYSTASHGVDKSEQEADRFAVQLLTQLFLEQYDHLPDTIEDLHAVYGV